MKKVAVLVFVGFWVVVLGGLSLLGKGDERELAAPPPDAGAADATDNDGGGGVEEAVDAAVDADLGDAGTELLGFDGGKLELGDAPKTINIGVVLVQYRGAQGASRKARSKEAARTLAAEIAEKAKEDFAAAVKMGDPGSAENGGKMYRNILRPRLEFTLFSMKKGEVSGPVDTRRGFWIIRRIK